VGSGFIRPVAGMAYRAFATWRFNRLSHCQIAIKADDVTKNQSRKNLAINNYVLQGAQKRFLWAQATAVI